MQTCRGWSAIARASGTRAALCAVVALASSGCGTYAYAARGPGPDHNTLPIDRTKPSSTVRWSFLWGLVNTVWAPLDCTQTGPDGQCVAVQDPCEGRGVGQFETRLTWYSVPLAVVTLGTAIPSEVIIYCSTLEPPGSGP